MFIRTTPSNFDFLVDAANLVAVLLSTSSILLAGGGKGRAGSVGRFAEVNGVRLHYLIDGKGSPVVLLHGYTQTSHMWHPIIPALA